MTTGMTRGYHSQIAHAVHTPLMLLVPQSVMLSMLHDEETLRGTTADLLGPPP